MKIKFDNNGVLHVVPEDSTEMMALRYWEKEYHTHGSKMIEVDTEMPTEE